MKIVLHGIKTIEEWQCAHDAVKHAEKGTDFTLEYETPQGELTLVARKRGQVVHIQKK
jgi:hypothetical protein